MPIFTKNQVLLYQGLKLFTRLAIKVLCRKIVVNDPSVLSRKGPALLAANHPNSFLDSIILDTVFEQPVWALARGDAFRNGTHAKLLRRLKIMPVYRTSEGVENLNVNYQTFNSCVGLFKENSIVTIYSEALCVNEWHLRPLKKGTARLAIQAWEAGIPLEVIPVGINYSSFSLFGKNVHLNLGKPITANEVPPQASDGQRNNLFNQKLTAAMQELVYEISSSDHSLLEKKLGVPIAVTEKILWWLPAKLGQLLHYPLYTPIKNIVQKRFKNTGHIDSVISSLLLLTYPLYLLLLFLLCWMAGLTNMQALVIVIIMPFLAWAHVRIKPQFDHQVK
jgi:1-acyl-sn-glycerol-3-phosphate acyltransferase